MRSKKKVVVKKKRMVVAIIVALLILALIAGLGIFVLGKTKKEKPKEEPPKKQGLMNPLTGLEVTSLPNRAFMLSTGNDNKSARPQSGLESADLIYEVPIEGGGSRLEPIYYSKVPGKCGSVRSARPYIIDLAREYGAVLVHNGESTQATEYFKKGVMDHIAAAEYWDIFWRSEDRKIPDNCYTDGEKVWTQIKALDMDKEKKPRTFPFLKGKPDSALPEATEIDVNYVSASNHYVYNPETKLYARSLYGEPFIDKETGNQLNVANVIVQTVTIDRVDEAQRLFLAMTKGGECAVFTQGKVIEGTWTKEDEEAPTIFKDKNGKEIELTPGVTFIQLIDYTVKFAYQ